MVSCVRTYVTGTWFNHISSIEVRHSWRDSRCPHLPPFGADECARAGAAGAVFEIGKMVRARTDRLVEFENRSDTGTSSK